MYTVTLKLRVADHDRRQRSAISLRHCTCRVALPFTVIVVSPEPTGAESGVMSAIRTISPSAVVAQVLGLLHFAWWGQK